MQQVMRSYATAGVALLGASMIAVTPPAVPLPGVQTRAVQLVDAWSDLFTDTAANLQSISNGADSQAIAEVYSALFSNPLGVIQALTDLDPTVTTSAGTVSVELTPALELGLAQLGSEGAALTAIEGVFQQLASDPGNALSILYEGVATVLNAYLNGASNVSLLDGAITLPGLNGILAPELSGTVNINLTDLLNALGLGSLDLSKLGDLSLGSFTLPQLLNDLFPNGISLSGIDLGSVLDALGVGKDTVGSLLSDVPGFGGLSSTVLGELDGVSLDQLVNGVTIGNVELSNVVTQLFSTVPQLDSLTLEDLLTDLKLPDLLDGLNLGDLLNGSLADITVSPLGGLLTELVDTVPQQILASLGG